MERELLALLVEVSSVPAAGKQLRKPIQVPRPKRRRTSTPGPAARGAAKAVSVLARTAKSVVR